MIAGYGKLYGLRTLPGGVILCAASAKEEEGKLIKFPIMMFPDGSHITLADVLVSEDDKSRIYLGVISTGSAPTSRARCVMHLWIVGYATGDMEGGTPDADQVERWDVDTALKHFKKDNSGSISLPTIKIRYFVTAYMSANKVYVAMHIYTSFINVCYAVHTK
jgi:hypothetical protein